jgi:hypothetical protein
MSTTPSRISRSLLRPHIALSAFNTLNCPTTTTAPAISHLAQLHNFCRSAHSIWRREAEEGAGWQAAGSTRLVLQRAAQRQAKRIESSQAQGRREVGQRRKEGQELGWIQTPQVIQFDHASCCCDVCLPSAHKSLQSTTHPTYRTGQRDSER